MIAARRRDVAGAAAMRARDGLTGASAPPRAEGERDRRAGRDVGWYDT